MFLAEFDTPNHSLQAYGNDEREAVLALDLLWQEHARRTGADPRYLTVYAEDVQVRDLSDTSVGWVDGQPVRLPGLDRDHDPRADMGDGKSPVLDFVTVE